MCIWLGLQHKIIPTYTLKLVGRVKASGTALNNLCTYLMSYKVPVPVYSATSMAEHGLLLILAETHSVH